MEDAQQPVNGGGQPARETHRTPPYISLATLKSLFSDLKAHGIPPQIDRSVMPRFSGGTQGQVLLALRSLGLIEDANKPTPMLATVVDAYETDRFPAVLADVVRATYPYVFALDLKTATPSMFNKAFSDNLSAKEDVLRKVRTFFLHAAKEAGIEIGTRIEKAKNPRPAKAPAARKPPAKPVVTPEDSDGGPPKVIPTISEKALEYRLVDLMTEAAGKADVMNAIITVITFLKTKDAPQASGGSNGTGQGG